MRHEPRPASGRPGERGPAAPNRGCYGGMVTVHLIHAPVDVGLRPWVPGDAEELAAMYAAAREELTADAPWRTPQWFTVRGQRERIRRSLEVELVEGFVITASAAIVGNLSLDEIRRDILQSADIGYWVAPGARRRGVATGAIALAVGHAFGCLDLHRIHATVDVGNRASSRALENNGFHRVGIIRGFAMVGGRWRDHHLYQLSAEDWLDSRPR